MYDIIKDDAIPENVIHNKNIGNKKYPIVDLKIGESFKFSLEKLLPIRNIASQYKSRNRHNGWDYVWQKIDDKTGQLWRIK